MSRADVSPRVKSARNRRARYEAELASVAGEWRKELWRLAAWLVAEARQMSDESRRRVVTQVRELVVELNERNAS